MQRQQARTPTFKHGLTQMNTDAPVQGFNARNTLSGNSLPEPDVRSAAAVACAERAAPHIAIGILAWNEDEAIEATLNSLLRQSLFANLARRNLNCEIICVANGCTDGTASVAASFFAAQRREHPSKAAFTGRVPGADHTVAASLG